MQRFRILSALSISLLFLFANQQLPGQTAGQPPSAETIKKMEEVRKRYTETETDRRILSRLLTIASDKSIVSELQIVDEQLEEIKLLAKEYSDSIRELSVKRAKRMQEIKKVIADGDHEKGMQIALESQEESIASAVKFGKPLREILLPHQIDRIEQLYRQKSLKYRSKFYGMFGMPLHLSNELSLTDQEKEKLEKVTQEADEEIRKEIAKLNEKLMKRILDSLPNEKQDAYQEIVGDFYDEEAARKKRYSRLILPAEKTESAKSVESDK